MDNIKLYAIELYKIYESKPILKALIQAITYNDLPIGAVGDSILATYVNNLKTEKLRTFFEQLDNGKVELTENLIADNDFLHAYFATVNHVLRTRSDIKIKAFAEILKSLILGEILIDDFDDYVKIFEELTEREFIILSIKYDYERRASALGNDWNPAQRTSSYWKDFKLAIKEKLGLEQDELNAMLVRIQRTGCYKKHQGYWDESHEEEGDTTTILKKIVDVVKE